MNSIDPYERYQRQIILKEFGEAGQQKLLQAKVLVIGAGGLGCPVLLYLVAAGIGSIGIADYDAVALNNLHRQVLYTVNDIGKSKAESAASVLQQLNPDIKIIPYNERLTVQNILTLIMRYDIIIDGTDNFSTRYIINDACVLMNKPLVYGAISQYEGQTAIFNYRRDENEEAVNYRDLFPQPPKEDEVLNCSEAGVLGVLPGIIGTMMAAETIKLITAIGEPLINRLLTYNVLTNELYHLVLSARKETGSLIPKDEAAFLQMDYEWLCGSSSLQTVNEFEIDAGNFDKLLASGDAVVIDVREKNELPAVTEFTCMQIPLGQWKENLPAISEKTIIVFCQTGRRSLQAAQLLFNTFGKTKKIYSLKEGIVQWKKHQAKLPV
jgi:sulfur-carrier protein adenylyltransferase/sulfurtransferase